MAFVQSNLKHRLDDDYADAWRGALVRDDATIEQAVAVIDRGGVHAALVVDAGDRLVGVVDDNEVRCALLRNVPLSAPVETAMRRQVPTAPADAPREERRRLMTLARTRFLPLLDRGGRVVGLDTADDLQKHPVSDHPVVIMAGGLGQRLRPLTAHTPKPLLRVGGQPLLETTVRRLRNQGFSNLFISVNYKAEMIMDYFGDGRRFGVNISYIRETQRLGTAGALGLLPDRPEKPFLVMNADLLTTTNFAQLLEFHLTHDSLATIATRLYSIEIPYGVVQNDGVLLSQIAEKPVESRFVSAGIYALEPTVLDSIARDQYLDMPDLLRQLQMQQQRICVFPLREHWLDIGRREDLDSASEKFMSIFAGDRFFSASAETAP